MTVGSLCQRDVEVATPEENVLAATRRMRDAGVGSLVVCDARRHPVGILTDRDVVVRVVAEGNDPAGVTVSDAMTPDPATVSESVSTHEAVAQMCRHRVRRLPVVGHSGELAGMIAVDDVLSHLGGEMSDLANLLDKTAHCQKSPEEEPSSVGE